VAEEHMCATHECAEKVIPRHMNLILTQAVWFPSSSCGPGPKPLLTSQKTPLLVCKLPSNSYPVSSLSSVPAPAHLLLASSLFPVSST
jgi:hypothetical protein